MTKIFDALNRKSGLGGDPALAALVEEFHGQPVFAAEPAAAPAPLPHVGPVRQTPGVAIRTVALQIPLQSPLLPFAGENGHAAEQYRIARTRILQHPRRPR